MKQFHKLKPIYNKNSKILILGSFPSVISRENNFYYANITNRFWKVLEKLFNVTLITNEDKINFLHTNYIALWDVIHSCDIHKSSDSSIKNVKPNDVVKLIKNTNIKYIFVNGRTAYNLYNKYLLKETNIEAFYLPSTSSANAAYSLDKLVCEYQKILKYLKK